MMIEILVTIVVCVIGLWGLSEVQARLQQSEVESYQRSQALMLLGDMEARLNLNRTQAAEYVTANALGPTTTCSGVTSADSMAQADLREWCDLLQGVSETTTSGSTTTNVGAMIGARGCVEDLGGGDFMVTVAWQGLAPLSAPPSSVSCGSGSYNQTGTACSDDRCRRVLTTIVRVGDLACTTTPC
jgi:type IV pilus assembly protein PilV